METINDIIDYMPNPFSKIEIILFTIFSTILLLLSIKVFLNLLKPKPKSDKEKLLELTFNTKESLFKFTKLARSINNSQALQEILKELEPYLYKKGYKTLPKELENRIKEYIKNV